jgi:1,2-diacylglycerol 3-alpha-glucosyltransferase
MKILFVNPYLYTSETKNVQKRNSIKDTMSYGLCCAFAKAGHDITLYACSTFEPTVDKKFPFKVVFERARFTKILPPNMLPFLPKLKRFIKQGNFDLIIASECFSLTTLACVKASPNKTIIWQELAAYQHAFHQIPAKLWYKFIVKHKFKNVRIVARSDRAKIFASHFSNNVSNIVIDHGVDLKEFVATRNKRKQFIVVSQLIPRKCIDKTISAFCDFCDKYDDSFKLIIVGDGISKNSLVEQAKNYKWSSHIIFKGFLSHDELMDDLSHSMAMLINTNKDDNMITIDESLACCTPVITNTVPFTSDFIQKDKTGIVKDTWDADALEECVKNNKALVEACYQNRSKQDYAYKISQFISIIEAKE